LFSSCSAVVQQLFSCCSVVDGTDIAHERHALGPRTLGAKTEPAIGRGAKEPKERVRTRRGREGTKTTTTTTTTTTKHGSNRWRPRSQCASTHWDGVSADGAGLVQKPSQVEIIRSDGCGIRTTTTHPISRQDPPGRPLNDMHFEGAPCEVGSSQHITHQPTNHPTNHAP